MSIRIPALKKKGKTSTADREIGKRIRHCRHYLGLSQKDVGTKIGVSIQQLQKYETGANRVSGSTIQKLSHILGVDIRYFFGGGSINNNAKNNASVLAEAESVYMHEDDNSKAREIALCVKLFREIPTQRLRKAVIELMTGITKINDE